MFIVVHLYGGLLESVTPYQSIALAQKGLAEAIPEPCACDTEDESLPEAKGVCDCYQEAYLVDVPLGLNGPEVTMESRHTPSKQVGR